MSKKPSIDKKMDAAGNESDKNGSENNDSDELNTPQPSTSSNNTSALLQSNDSEVGNDKNINSKVSFVKLKTNLLKNRHFRRKNTLDYEVSSDDDEPTTETLVDGSGSVGDVDGEEQPNVQNATYNDDNRDHLSSSEDNNSVISNSDLDDMWEPVNNTELQKNLCDRKLMPNWYAIQELYKRQQGYSAKLNGHLQFQHRYYGSLHVAQRFELMAMMEFHDGCVNALGFNPTGSLLASASDDLRIVLWDWSLRKRKTSWVTRHRSNVFQCKFLNLSGQSELQLVSSARDGEVWLWQLDQEGLRGSRKLGKHRGASHKLTLLKDQPHVILSCGEDGLVFSHDVREDKPNKLTYAMNSENHRIALYSIYSHPLNSSEFCVSGHDPAVAVYDQRFLRKDGAPMKRFSIDQKKMFDGHITASVYNYCGSEILASYNDNDIYLFDTSMPGTNNYVHIYQGHRNSATIKGVNFFGPRSEYVISGSDCGNIFFWDKNTQAIVQFLLADKGVVNCLEPHPSMPILASSGLDSDVKVWLPSREEPNKMDDLVPTVTNNLRRRTVNNMNGFDNGDNRMIWMLWQVMERSRRTPATRRRSESSTSDAMMDDDNPDASDNTSDSNSSNSDDNNDQDGSVECLPS